MSPRKRKTIVLDTSVLLYDKKAIESFPGNDVILPLVVMDEIDRFKEKPGLLGENARYINRFLDDARSRGPLHTGVSVGDDQTITVRLTYPECPQNFPLDAKDSDNRILLEALQIHSGDTEKSLVMVTKDINLRVKCDAVGLRAEDYYRDYIDLPEESWSGVVEIEPTGNEIDKLYSEGRLSYDNSLSHNTFVVMKTASKQSCLCVYDARTRELLRVTDTDVRVGNGFPISGKNKEQKFALWALHDNNTPLVTLTGLAGSGKTFLSLMSGISQVQQGKFERIVITRNIQPVGKDIGFLPGDIDEKMGPWLAPVIDNLRNHLKDKETFDLMKVNGLIEVAPMSFIRGRTFANSFIILDEAQNSTIHELKTVITRTGEGSKIVLMGDTDQIDTPYIGKNTNGLSIVTKKMRDSLYTAHVHLPVGIRSSIASEASHLL
jgi:PhoH-like ATPase